MAVLADEYAVEKYFDARAAGEDVRGWKFGGEVKEVNGEFKKWVRGNEERIEMAQKRGTLPYFIRDNQRKVDIILGKKKTALEIAKERHAARTPEQIADIKRRAAEREDRMALEKALGIKQGKPMTFKQANEHRGNPHFGEDVKYGVNCQSCVVANEMRRRGWSIEVRQRSAL